MEKKVDEQIQQGVEVNAADAAQFFEERMVSENVSSDMCHWDESNTLTDDENDKLMAMLKQSGLVK